MTMSGHVILNVGGTIFETKAETLTKFPSTLLGSLDTSSLFYIHEKQQYFFDRNPDLFNTVLDFYRNGYVHIPTNMCGWVWKQELQFWKIPVTDISECCLPTYMKFDKDNEVAIRLKDAFKVQSREVWQNKCTLENIRRRLWLILDEPTSSLAARIYGIIYLLMVLLSTCLLMAKFHPDARQKIVEIEMIVWFFKSENIPIWFDKNNPKFVMFLTTKLPDWVHQFDHGVTAFFTLDLVLRLVCCPNLRNFLKIFLNILDIILLCAMWSGVILQEGFKDEIAKDERLVYLFSFTHSILVFRLLRFFRVTKQYSALRVLLMAVRESIKELGLLLVTFMIFATLFANIIFFAEIHEPSTFPDVLVGLWWAVVTMTTVGYGDVVPKSVLGRIVGSLCAISGLLLLAMPVAVIAGKFNELYTKNADREAFNDLQKSRNKCTHGNSVKPFIIDEKKMELKEIDFK